MNLKDLSAILVGMITSRIFEKCGIKLESLEGIIFGVVIASIYVTVMSFIK